jgi:hypothetical protein
MKAIASALIGLAASLPLAAGADTPATAAAPQAKTLAAVLQKIPASIVAVPEPSNAWLFGLGFLGLVVLRRTRSGPLD